MTFRKFDTETWHDPWFESLEKDERYLFIYLWTNELCNQAGLYEITLRRIEFDTKIPSTDLEPLLKGISRGVRYWPEDGVVFVRSFMRRQCQNKQFAETALNTVLNKYAKFAQVFLNANKLILERYKIAIPDLPKNHPSTTLGPPLNPPSTEVPCIINRSRAEQSRTEKIPEPKKSNSSPPSPAPSGPPDGGCAPRPKNGNPKGHFKNHTGNYFEPIKALCESICDIQTAKPKKKPFNPWAWVQQQVNHSKHPGAIGESLKGILSLWDTIEDPWAYCNSILKTQNGNFNEKDAIAKAQEFKTIWADPKIQQLAASIGLSF